MLNDVLYSQSKVFKNRDVFNISYLPEKLQANKEELKIIYGNIKPLLEDKKPLNTIITGKSSTGKTTLIRYAISEINKNTNIKTCYINCNLENKKRKCYFKLYNTLFGHDANKYQSTEIIHDKIIKEMKNQKLILAIDDINILPEHEAIELINELFRLNEYYDMKIALIISINDIAYKYSLPDHIQTILTGYEIHLNKFSQDETYQIIKYRCKQGFKDNTITQSQIKKLVKYIINMTDIRDGLIKLEILGQKLENENRNKITDNDLKDHVI